MVLVSVYWKRITNLWTPRFVRQMNTITMLGSNSSSGSCYMNYGTTRNSGNNARNLNRCFAMDLAPEFINTDLLVQQRYWAYNGATASGQESGVCAAIFKIPLFYTVTWSENCVGRTALGGIILNVWFIEINHTKGNCSAVIRNTRITP